MHIKMTMVFIALVGAGGKSCQRFENCCFYRRSAMDKLKILFDTDIGTDIDDALALTFLLNEPRC